MVESNEQPEKQPIGYSYDIISNEILPPIDNFNAPSLMMNSTSVNHPVYKYWNPAQDNVSISHVQPRAVDQLKGESKHGNKTQHPIRSMTLIRFS